MRTLAPGFPIFFAVLAVVPPHFLPTFLQRLSDHGNLVFGHPGEEALHACMHDGTIQQRGETMRSTAREWWIEHVFDVGELAGGLNLECEFFDFFQNKNVQ